MQKTKALAIDANVRSKSENGNGFKIVLDVSRGKTQSAEANITEGRSGSRNVWMSGTSGRGR
jgi:hypothetical protein